MLLVFVTSISRNTNRKLGSELLVAASTRSFLLKFEEEKANEFQQKEQNEAEDDPISTTTEYKQCDL